VTPLATTWPQIIGEYWPTSRTVSCVDDKDKPHYLELLRVLGAVGGWLARIGPEADRPQPPPPGSPLRADDDLAHPYDLSHAAWLSLTHAVDHLGCLNTLLADAHVVHLFAPYSLVRSALENSSAAVWMLHPPNRIKRLTRRLRFATADIHNGEEAKRLTGSQGPRSEKERINEVRDIARRAGVDADIAVSHVGYSEIVRAAGSALDSEAAVRFSWKLCSGVTHGDLWTTLSAAEKVELPDAPPGLGAFKIEASLPTLKLVTIYANIMTGLGWHLYDQRSRPPF
jgi:hypothetical protein